MLIGPLAAIKREVDGLITYGVDFSLLGALERFETEEKQWWNNYRMWKDEF